MKFLRFLFFCLILESCFLNLASISYAQTPAPTTNEVLQIIRQKVQEKLKLITDPTIVKKGLIGKIIQIDAQSFTIESGANTILASYNAETTFIDKNRNKTRADKFKIGQEILLLGYSNSETGIFDARRVIATELAPLELKRTALVGKIVDMSKTTPIFTLIPVKNNNQSFQIKMESKTVILGPDDIKLKPSDLKSGHKIIALVRPDPKSSKSYIALRIIDLDYAPLTPTSVPTKRP